MRKKCRIAVVGLGYVGLPLALEFVKNGFSVAGIEVDPDRLKHIKERTSYITDISDKELRKAIATGRFSAAGNFAVLKSIDAVIICVPTPLKRKYHPDISFIKQAVRSIASNIKKGALIILESTTYPGTTEEIILPIFQDKGLAHGRDFYLAFSPERIDPGNKTYTVDKIPKIVGGLNSQATQRASMLYQGIIRHVVCVSSARVAEAAKLLENTFRLVNIGLIDELAMMAHKMNINIWEVVAAAATKPFGFMPFYPGPGVGGHCIPKDPLYLFWKAKRFGFHSRFIRLASEVISFMPTYVAQRIERILESKGIALKKAKILVLGVTYKKDIKDLRKSPAIDTIIALQKKGARVDYHDPIIPFLKLNHSLDLRSKGLSIGELKKYDCAVIATDHSKLPYNLILKHSSCIFDCRNAYKKIKNPKIFRL